MSGKKIMTVREAIDKLSYNEIIQFSDGRYQLSEKDKSELLKVYKVLAEEKENTQRAVSDHSIVISESSSYDACLAKVMGGMPMFFYSYDEYIDMMIIDDSADKDISLEELFLIVLLCVRWQHASKDENMPLSWNWYIRDCKNGRKRDSE